MLESLMPRAFAASAAAASSPKRMVLINASMGLLPKDFFPEGAGKGYKMSNYLSEFEGLREKFSVFSGLSHPEVDGGHHADFCFLTGASHPGGSGFKNTISLDQYAAERIGIHTRVPSLVLHGGAEAHKSGLSWTSSGVNVPAEDSPSRVYKRLFLKGSPAETEARLEELRTGRSVLDAVSDRAKSMGRSATAADRDKLDEYFTSVRELEGRLVTAGEWELKEKPKVDAPMPVDIEDQSDVVGRTRLMYDMIKLALQTDSTRVVSLKVHSYNRVLIPGVSEAHHALTHHGGREQSLKQLRLIELARLRELKNFLGHLEGTEGGGWLPARQHDGHVWLPYGRCQPPLQYQSSHHARGRRLPPRGAPRLRPGKERPPCEPLRQHAPAHGLGNGFLRLRHRAIGRTGGLKGLVKTSRSSPRLQHSGGW